MRLRVTACMAATICAALACAPAVAQQRINIPPATLSPSNPGAANFAPTLGTPQFDPYAGGGITPVGAPAPIYTPPIQPQYGAPAVAPQYAAPPAYGVPSYGAPAPAYGAPAFGQPTYGQPPLYSQPYGNPYAFGATSPSGVWSDDVGRPNPYQSGEPLRFFQNIRLRHTWISRMDELDGLGINDTELATTAAFPQFLYTTQPLYVSPGFILHLWDGPSDPESDLPPRAYTGYVDFDYTTNPALRLGGDLHVRLGLYSDFEAFNTHSFRISGRGLGTFRLTPEMQLKFGVEYINRNDLKLLPAGGLLWTPNPHVRFDIYFPKPKLAVYLTTLGQTEIWGYVGAEYGGGAWTIERAAGGDDRIDINDYRVFIGTEFMAGYGLKGFVEAGWVFNREIVYVGDPTDNFEPGDSFMLRGGIAY